MDNDVEGWKLTEPPSDIDIPIHIVYIYTDGREPELDWLELDEFLAIGTQCDAYIWHDYEHEPIKPPFLDVKKARLSDWDSKGFLIIIGDGDRDIIFNQETFNETYKEYLPFLDKKLFRDAKAVYERCLKGYTELVSKPQCDYSKILGLGMRLGEASAFIGVLKLKGVRDENISELSLEIVSLQIKINDLLSSLD